MEIKHNDATTKRPEGDRVLDAPFVFADIPKFIGILKDEKTWEKNDRNAITVFKTEGMTIVLTLLKAGAFIRDNSVNGFLTVQLLEGSIRMETLERDYKMIQHQLISFHPEFPHSIEALSDSILLLFTYELGSHKIL